MEKKEIIKIMGVLKIAYPNSFKKMSDTDFVAMTELWYRQFKDYDYGIVMNAIDSIISTDTREFYPPIGVIKEMIYKLNNTDELTEYEAWNLVSKAIKNGIYGSVEEFEKLPPVVQKIVGGPEQLRTWAIMDSGEIHTVVASNFQRSYKVRAKNEKYMQAIPLEVKQALGIEQLTKKLKLKD